jgi:hypothetical protein
VKVIIADGADVKETLTNGRIRKTCVT